jgi:hypothetical protein
MTLHTDRELFKEIIDTTAKDLNLPFLYIEKDYWVTYVLKNLANSQYSDIAIFKGGTSLSKAYKIIERFSEDIDLAVITDGESSNQIKKLIKKIEVAILDENFNELPEHEQTSKGSEFRKTLHDYAKLENGDFGHASESIILELNSFAYPHPFELKEISTYIFDFLSKAAPTMIEQYNLEPFHVNVLNYKRTFCEKISAIARASHESDDEQTQLKEKIRHFYDIYFLMNEKEIDLFLNSNEFVDMIEKVRVDDQNQFNQNNWATIPLYTTKIFTDTSVILDQLSSFYTNNFKDLVYAQTLPQINDIKSKIEVLARILTINKL